MHEGNTVDELTQELNAIQIASNLSCNYQKTLALLRALKAGTVSLDNVTMVADGWTVGEVEPPVEPVEDAVEPPVQDE
jgi:hypothetical protein